MTAAEIARLREHAIGKAVEILDALEQAQAALAKANDANAEDKRLWTADMRTLRARLETAAADEREACAKVADKMASDRRQMLTISDTDRQARAWRSGAITADEIAAAIRARAAIAEMEK